MCEGVPHGLINYINAKAKCCYLKNLPYQGTLRQVFICLRSHIACKIKILYPSLGILQLKVVIQQANI